VMAALAGLADVVATAACRTIPQGQPIVGETAFTHESGIHVSGLLRDPGTYEALDPAIFGRQRRILLGKHSGSASLRDALQGMDIPQVVLPDLLVRLRAHAERVKRSVTRDEVMSMLAVAAE
jgi:homocitrate synthase NifV